MGLRGPKSDSHKISRIYDERPKPPKYLPGAAKEAWCNIVESLPPGHFRVSELPLLEKYCMAIHISGEATKITDAEGLVVEMGEKGYRVVNPALVISNKQVALMCTLATKLRLCPNSRVSKWSAATIKEVKPSRRPGLMFGGSKKDEEE